MAESVSAHQKQHSEVQQTCDGCVQLHPSSELVPVGDGSIQVCEGCYAQAMLMVVNAVDMSCSPKSEMNWLLLPPPNKSPVAPVPLDLEFQ